MTAMIVVVSLGIISLSFANIHVVVIYSLLFVFLGGVGGGGGRGVVGWGCVSGAGPYNVFGFCV